MAIYGKYEHHMKLTEMLSLFENNGIPKSYYVVGGLGLGECLGIERIDQKWHVYYSERGQKTTQAIFDSEDEACHFMIDAINERLKEDMGRSVQ